MPDQNASLARAASGAARPVLRVRCPNGHRYGDVYRTSDGKLLWAGRLPAPSRAWSPHPQDRARPPLPAQEQSHWAQASWHSVELQRDALDYVLTGCRCSRRPAFVLWVALQLDATDRTRREVLLRPRLWPSDISAAA